MDCRICDEKFKDEDKLKDHLSHKHNTNIYTCSLCSEIFHNDISYLSHCRTAHLEHPCPHCFRVYKKRVTLQSHIQREHQLNKSIKCTKCFEEFFNQIAFRSHCISHKPGKVYHRCTDCPRSFADKIILNLHEKFDHRYDGHKKFAKYIEKNFGINNRKQLRDSNRCIECDIRFTYKIDLFKHLKLLHRRKFYYQCCICNLFYNSNDSIRTHLVRIHSIPRSHSCRKCKKPHHKPKKNNGNKLNKKSNDWMNKFRRDVPNGVSLNEATEEEVENLRFNIRHMFHILCTIPSSVLTASPLNQFGENPSNCDKSNKENIYDDEDSSDAHSVSFESDSISNINTPLNETSNLLSNTEENDDESIIYEIVCPEIDVTDFEMLSVSNTSNIDADDANELEIVEGNEIPRAVETIIVNNELHLDTDISRYETQDVITAERDSVMVSESNTINDTSDVEKAERNEIEAKAIATTDKIIDIEINSDKSIDRSENCDNASTYLHETTNVSDANEITSDVERVQQNVTDKIIDNIELNSVTDTDRNENSDSASKCLHEINDSVNIQNKDKPVDSIAIENKKNSNSEEKVRGKHSSMAKEVFKSPKENVRIASASVVNDKCNDDDQTIPNDFKSGNNRSDIAIGENNQTIVCTKEKSPKRLKVRRELTIHNKELRIVLERMVDLPKDKNVMEINASVVEGLTSPLCFRSEGEVVVDGFVDDPLSLLEVYTDGSNEIASLPTENIVNLEATNESEKNVNQRDIISSPTNCICCIICKSNVYTPLQLLKHFMKVHGCLFSAQTLTELLCVVCGFIFNDENSFDYHVNSIHVFKDKFKCHFCGDTCDDVVTLKEHLACQHHDIDEKVYICDVYKKTLRKNNIIKVLHQPRKQKVGKTLLVQCELCKKTFADDCYLKLHKELFHKMKPYDCNKCKKCFINEIQLNEHKCLDNLKLNNEGDKPGSEGNKSVNRNEILPNKPKIVNETKEKNDEKKSHMAVKKRSLMRYVCKICKCAFRSRRELCLHEKYGHAIKRCHKCLKCEQKFKSKKLLVDHIEKDHNVTVAKLYKCDVCPSVFKFSDKLMQHKNLKHEIRLPIKNTVLPVIKIRKANIAKSFFHTCLVCQSMFPTKELLQSHTKWEHNANVSFQISS